MTAIHPRLTVLLAEDDPNDVLLIQRALEKLRVLGRFIAVTDGDQVLAYFRSVGIYADRQRFPWPDLVILDHHMPRIAGLDVLFWFRTQASFKNLPVLILSVGLSRHETSILHRLNAFYCPKSCSHQDLTRSLKQGIGSVLDSLAAPGSIGTHASHRGNLAAGSRA